MPKVKAIDVEAIFLKHAGRPLEKKPYIRPGLENKKKKKDIKNATSDTNRSTD